MFTLDHVILTVADVDAASAAYTAVLGRTPSWHGAHPALGTRNTLFRLDNAYLELLADDAAAGATGFVAQTLRGRTERPFGVALRVDEVDAAVVQLRSGGLEVTDPMPGHGRDDAGGRERTWRSAFVDRDAAGGLRLLIIQHTTPPDALPPAPDASGDGTAGRRVDHLVVFTRDLDAAERLWTQAFGLHVAWRKDFPERRTRNLGLALGDVVLELIMRTDGDGPRRPQQLWGVAYTVDDCDRAVDRLRRAGVPGSDARPGLFPGTRVATLEWDRTPTLLLAAASASRVHGSSPT